MDGDLSEGDLELETWDGDNGVLVDDASWHDFGIWHFIPDELDSNQVWYQRALAKANTNTKSE